MNDQTKQPAEQTSNTSTHPLMHTYNRLPVAFNRGNSAYLVDQHEQTYLDALSGIAVCGLGHAHPAISQAIQSQADTLIHTSNLFQIPLQEQLAQKLCDISGLKQCFFSNSGGEANETAIKVARLWGHHKNIDHPKIIVFTGAFHGRTMANISASANQKNHEWFGPLLTGFVQLPFNDSQAIEDALKQDPSIVGIWLEPIQGEGGIQIPDPTYLADIQTLCHTHDRLLILDEVQTGNGRTGTYFAFQNPQLAASPIAPDILTTAKGLGNGYPIGVCMTGNRLIDLLQPGQHGTTYGGNPLACRVGLAVLETLEKEHILTNVKEKGNYLLQAFKEKLKPFTFIKEIRGCGLMFGIELNQACPEIVKIALEHQLIINVTAQSVIRILPPLIFNQNHADELIDKLYQVILQYQAHLEK